MIYLGTLGRMVGIKCPSSQQVQTAERFSFTTTLEGRVKAQSRPSGRRAWDLGMSDATTPEQLAALRMFTEGAWGAGPFVFVSSDAPFTNMLSPGASSLDPAVVVPTQGGPVLLPDGVWSPRSFNNSDPANELFAPELTPVVTGVSVTASAWVLGAGAKVRISWYDIAGAPLTPTISTVTASAGLWVRSFVTAKPPTGAASCRIVGMSCLRFTMPAITWSDTLLPWAAGEGCLKAVVSMGSRSLVLTGPGRTYSSAGFTVTEVG